MYTEKLVRRKSWYEENEKTGLLETAAEYWATFFGPLQTYCRQSNSSVQGINFSHFKGEMEKLGVDFDALGDLCENFGNLQKIPGGGTSHDPDLFANDADEWINP